MSATLTERTVLPGEPTQRMADLLVALRAHGRPALVAGDGTHIELPDELYEVLKDVVTALSQGLAITVAPQHTVLTTGQAVDLLGVSRPTLVRLLEVGEIPFDKPGRHRRIRLGDLLAYQQRARRARPLPRSLQPPLATARALTAACGLDPDHPRVCCGGHGMHQFGWDP